MSREKNVSFKAKCIEPREEKREHLVDGEDAYVTVEKEVLRTLVKTELINGVVYFTNENCDVKAMKHRAVVLFTQGNNEDRKWAMGAVKGVSGDRVEVNTLFDQRGSRVEGEILSVEVQRIKFTSWQRPSKEAVRIQLDDGVNDSIRDLLYE
jgi:hypothetical protein